MNKLISFLSTCFLVSVVCADPVTVPNTFSAGTPAKASEVNANFTTLTNAINTIGNLPKPLFLYDSTGKVIGQYFATVGGDESVIINSPTEGLLVVNVRVSGFFSWLDINLRGELYYASSDCSGQALAQNPSPPSFIKTVRESPRDNYGKRFNYIIENELVGVNIGSVFTDEGCKTSNTLLVIPTVVYRVRAIDLSSFIPPFSIH